MTFERYRRIYFKILLGFLFITNQLTLFLIIFIIHMSYFINMESNLNYIFDFEVIDDEDLGSQFLDYEVDNQHFYTLMHEELYLVSNCRFFFDLYGGETILDCIDFIDFHIYQINDQRNLKYIYANTKTYKLFLNTQPYELYNIQQNYINNNNEMLYIKKWNKNKDDDIWNIIESVNNKNIIQQKIRYKLWKHIK